MRWYSASGSGSFVCQWRAMRSSASRFQQKFSMNWLGSSTASHSTPLMPETLGKSTSVSRWCSPWPNSWNSVITSSCVSSDGSSAVGGAKLQVRNATGFCRAPSCWRKRVRHTSIHAPPRFAVRAYMSRYAPANALPFASTTSK